jgi:hypothetical protein
MALLKGKIEGGQGGKIGHSGMTHWTYTEEIKAAMKKRRRTEAKKMIQNTAQDER